MQPRPAGGKQVRPQLALHEPGGVRTPVIQEAGGPAWHVQRHEAVQDPPLQPEFRQAALQQPARRSRFPWSAARRGPARAWPAPPSPAARIPSRRRSPHGARGAGPRAVASCRSPGAPEAVRSAPSRAAAALAASAEARAPQAWPNRPTGVSASAQIPELHQAAGSTRLQGGEAPGGAGR